MSEHDTSKLPVWAQNMILDLESQVDGLSLTIEQLLREKQKGPEDSNTFADPYSAAPRPLGRDVHVRFNGMSTLEGTFDVRMRDGDLEVRANDTSPEMAILPHSSNAVRIRMVPRR